MSCVIELTPIADRELVLTRIIDAPREKLFRAWTDPNLLKQWFAPLPYITTVAELDVRPGGKWRIESHAADGNVYIFVGEYREVSEPEKFVWTFGMENMFFGKTLVETHTFAEDGAVTHYKSVSNYDSIEDRDGMVASGMEKGMRHGFAVMDQLLAELIQEA